VSAPFAEHPQNFPEIRARLEKAMADAQAAPMQIDRLSPAADERLERLAAAQRDLDGLVQAWMDLQEREREAHRQQLRLVEAEFGAQTQSLHQRMDALNRRMGLSGLVSTAQAAPPQPAPPPPPPPAPAAAPAPPPTPAAAETPQAKPPSGTLTVIGGGPDFIVMEQRAPGREPTQIFGRKATVVPGHGRITDIVRGIKGWEARFDTGAVVRP
jgi:cell division protein FtsN